MGKLGARTIAQSIAIAVSSGILCTPASAPDDTQD
jgi:hypothetical protein